MRPGAACALRICRSCRHSVQHQATFASIPSLTRGYARRRQKTANQSGIAQKDHIEALIRGDGPPVRSRPRQVSDWGSQSVKGNASRGRLRQTKRHHASDQIASKDSVEAMIRGEHSPSTRNTTPIIPRDPPPRSTHREWNTTGLLRSNSIPQSDPWAPTRTVKAPRIREDEVSNTEDLMNLLDALHNPGSIRKIPLAANQPASSEVTIETEKSVQPSVSKPEVLNGTETVMQSENPDTLPKTEPTIKDDLCTRQGTREGGQHSASEVLEDENTGGSLTNVKPVPGIKTDSLDRNHQSYEAPTTEIDVNNDETTGGLSEDSQLSANTIRDHPEQIFDDVEQDLLMDPAESFASVPDRTAKYKTRPRKKKGPRSYSDELLFQKDVGVTALGKRVDALILRNPNKMTSARVDVPIIERDQPSVPFDLQTVVAKPQQNNDEDILDEAFRNIEELRPTDTTVLRSNQFQELLDALVAGFTNAQLRQYLQAQPQAVTEDVAPYDWVLEHFDSVGTVRNRSDPDTSLGEMAGRKTGTAMRIMIRAWRLETETENQKVGKMGFVLRDDAWWLLNQPGSALAKTIRQDFLGMSRTESFVLAPSSQNDKNSLILRTSRATVSAILARIDDAVKSIASSTVPPGHLKAIKAQTWSQAHLDALANETHTRIVRDPSSLALTVSWIPSADRPAPSSDPKDSSASTRLETPADVVYRLMARNAFPEKDRRWRESLGLPNSIPYERGLRGLSAAQRIRLAWDREVSLQRENPSAKTASVSLSPWPETRPAHAGASEKLVATFGHVLRGSSKKHTPNIPNVPSHWAFLPTVPHPASISSIITNARSEEWKPVTKETAVILNFTPHPALAPDSKAFDVRLHVPVRPGADLHSFQIPPEARLELVAENRRLFKFPAAPVDSRVHAQHLIPLDITAPPIQEFLSASIFNLAEGRLRTPSTTSFDIPAASDDVSSAAPIKSTPYLFVGLEVHQSVEMPWRDVVLRYDSVEAGLHGGQRQELSIVADVPNECTEAARAEIYKSTGELIAEAVDGKYFSWSRGSANVESSQRQEK